jgi:hypothetical protein
MTNQNLSRVVIFLVLALAAQACGIFEKGKNTRRGEGTRNIFINGDVNQLLSGTIMSPKSFLEEASLQDFANFTFSGASLFASRSEYTVRAKADQKEIENRNSTSKPDYVRQLDSYQFSKPEPSSGRTFYDYSDPVNGDLTLRFNLVGTRLHLNSFKFKSMSDFVYINSVLHYSVDASKTKFSFLFKVIDSETELLIAMTFVKNTSSPTILDKVAAAYQYILGSGVRVRWSDKIQVSLCGPSVLANEQERRDEVLAWTQNGKLAGRELEVLSNATPPPFSDVNHHCIYEVENYFFEDNPLEGAVLGLTLPVVNGSSSEIVASDIFVASSTFDKLSRSSGELRSKVVKKTTYLHEFGHFLGLGHEFTKDNNGVAVYPSIMSYDDIDEIQKHDYEALDALYAP